VLLMAGIRERDKRAVTGSGFDGRIGISYHVCSMFAICSFWRTADPIAAHGQPSLHPPDQWL